MSDPTKQAARLTVSFLLLYAFTFINILRTKKRGAKLQPSFDRYTSPLMHTADRLQANFLEWSPIFLGLVWSLAATDNLDFMSLVAAWTYIALRLLYTVLILKHGVAKDGRNRKLWISTFPAYACLVVLTIRAVVTLF